MQLSDVIAAFRGISRQVDQTFILSDRERAMARMAYAAAVSLEGGGLDELKALELDLKATAGDRDNARVTLAECRAALAESHAGLEALAAERDDALAELSHARTALADRDLARRLLGDAADRLGRTMQELLTTRTQRDDARRSAIVNEVRRDEAVLWGLAAAEAGRMLAAQRDEALAGYRVLDKTCRKLADRLVAAEAERDALREAGLRVA